MSEPDAALTIALAEYAQLNDGRRAVSEQSHARFNFFLIIASASAAVAAGVTGTGRVPGWAVAAVGGVVLLLGVGAFARQVEFTVRYRRAAVAETAIRTYLVRRAPDLAPFVLMPTLDDDGPFGAAPLRRRWLRDAVGLAGTVGLLNGALVGFGAGFAVAGFAPSWAGAAAGLTVAAGAVTAHVAYVRRRLADTATQVEGALAGRSLPAR
ncbi:MAG TPA: hypothetical protein VES42_15235 [Pilimelia sp.]|nr:hypothetical protein [Pilimelia sp.]